MYRIIIFNTLRRKNKYNKKIEDIYKELNSSKEGLTSKEALLRIKKYGLNTLPKKKSDSFIKIFFKDILEPLYCY